MKKIILLSILHCCLIACGQRKTTDNSVKENDPPELFDSKYVKLSPDTTRMMLIENVVIHYGDLYAEADSVFFDKPGRSVIVYSVKKAIFKGKEITPAEIKHSIHYKKGDEKLNIE